jgi:hypothetical protein
MSEQNDSIEKIVAEMRRAAERCGELPDGDPYQRPDARDLREWAERLAAAPTSKLTRVPQARRMLNALLGGG